VKNVTKDTHILYTNNFVTNKAIGRFLISPGSWVTKRSPQG